MNKYKWLLFDLDNTLLDFSSASKIALWKTFEDYDLTCNEEIYKIYKKENAKVWISFENKEIDTLTLRKIRFAGFFEVMGIKDIDPFVFNARYLEHIVLASETYDGVPQLIKDLKTDYQLGIITNGLKEVQRPRLQKVNMIDEFQSIVVSDEIGVAKPDVKFFEHTYTTLSDQPQKSEILVIGDNLMSDVLGGHRYEVDTCWISHGKENTTDVKPVHQINTVLELSKVL